MAVERQPGQGGYEYELNTISTADAALIYAQNGWPIFPLYGKIPLKNSHGHRDATTDLDQIEQWWSQHPTANIGLATGEVSGVLVVDMDPRHGGYESYKRLQAEHEPFPQTRT